MQCPTRSIHDWVLLDRLANQKSTRTLIPSRRMYASPSTNISVYMYHCASISQFDVRLRPWLAPKRRRTTLTTEMPTVGKIRTALSTPSTPASAFAATR